MKQSRGGFTIIEVMLVMAVTGLVAMTLLIGWTINVNTQSYKDSTNSLVAYLQLQYDEIFNVSNDRGRTLTCVSGGGAGAYDGTTPSTNRGSSDCVIMGRYLSVSGANITTRRIIGVEPLSTVPTPTTDLMSIQQYSPYYSNNGAIESASVFDIPWGATLYGPGDPTKTATSLNIVIMRSPISGAVYTYVVPGGVLPPNTSLNTRLATATTNKVTLCLNPQTVISSTPVAVTIDANASTPEAVGVQSREQGNACAL